MNIVTVDYLQSCYEGQKQIPLQASLIQVIRSTVGGGHKNLYLLHYQINEHVMLVLINNNLKRLESYSLTTPLLNK